MILKWGLFEYNARFEKRFLLCRFEIGIFDIFFKRLYEDSLKIYKSIVIENFKPVPLCPIKWQSFKVFVKLLKSPLLIANIVESAVSGLSGLTRLKALEN